jgi:hypothetical protein
LIGYSIVKLYDTCITNGEQNLKLITDIPKNNYNNESEYKYISEKTVFNVDFFVCSTLYTIDKNLAIFLNYFHNTEIFSNDFIESIKNLHNCPPNILINYFPIIINQLLRVMSYTNKNVEGNDESLKNGIIKILKKKKVKIKLIKSHKTII